MIEKKTFGKLWGIRFQNRFECLQLSHQNDWNRCSTGCREGFRPEPDLEPSWGVGHHSNCIQETNIWEDWTRWKVQKHRPPEKIIVFSFCFDRNEHRHSYVSVEYLGLLECSCFVITVDSGRVDQVLFVFSPFEGVDSIHPCLCICLVYKYLVSLRGPDF